ncbi:MAG TPA: cobalt-precorrin-5B (C(1))-methyltransferase [Nitrososphaeraceae archaeon]|nr:cobalt-precorrin-5B (C(1))-methyltransferase [Nitrososphaeraceae archaeon]
MAYLEKSEEEDEEEGLKLAEQEQELPFEIEEKRKQGKLRTGYTTGTSAAAATKAALLALIYGRTVDTVVVSLPKEKQATIKVAWTRIEGRDSATSAVIKYAGDDPDITDGAEICSTVSFSDEKDKMLIDGGKGVGRITKPGLGLEIGKAAINPTPIKMIEQAVQEVLVNVPHMKEHGISVIISVPKGEELAKRTDNPRLGILGGISILGTTGIVLPYSTASFAASIRQSLDVSLASGTYTVVLTTGGRSEDFAKAILGESLPDHSFIQIGDFAGYAIKQCSNKKIHKAIIAGFIGKLTKMAMGIKQTHVRGSHVNMDFMAKIAAECNSSQSVIQEIRGANTARHVSEIIKNNNVNGFFDLICRRVYEQMYEHSKRELEIKVIMFEFDGSVCGQYP